MSNEFDKDLLREMHKRRDERRFEHNRVQRIAKGKAKLKAHLAAKGIRHVGDDPTLIKGVKTHD